MTSFSVSAGGTGFDSGSAIAVDDSGNSYLAGSFEGASTFGAGGSAVSVTSNGSLDAVIAKYDLNGELLWVETAGGATVDAGTGISVDGSGNSYLTGYFGITATFGSGGDAVMLSSQGFSDVFIAKYDVNGSLLWAEKAGGTNPDQAQAITVDDSGNSYVTGRFSLTATFGTGRDAVDLVGVGGE